MTFSKEPYYMKDKSWYYHDEEKGIDVLTPEAPPEAVKSYKEFYDALNSQNEGGLEEIFQLIKKMRKENKTEQEIREAINKIQF